MLFATRIAATANALANAVRVLKLPRRSAMSCPDQAGSGGSCQSRSRAANWLECPPRMPILARILKDRGLLTDTQLQEAVQHQVLFGGRLGTSLWELGMISEEQLQDALCRAHGLKPSGFDPREVEPEAVQLVSRELAEKHKVCPYKVKGRTLQLLMVDPRDHVTLASIGFRLGYIIKPVVVPEFSMIRLLHQHYAIDERWRFHDTHVRRSAPIAPLATEAAAALLGAANNRDEVVAALLSACLGFFKRVLCFIVREPWLLGWSAAGEGVDVESVSQLRIPLDTPSVFQGVVRDRTLFLGRLGADDESVAFLKMMGKKATSSAALFTIGVKGRVVNLVYGDAGPSANVRTSLGELMVLVQKVPRAYLRIISKRISEAQKESDNQQEEETKTR